MKLDFKILVFLLVIVHGTAWADQPTRKLKVGLSWIHQAQFTGEYFAQQKGLYRAKGLEVELIPVTIGKDPLNDLIAGKIDIVIAQPASLIIAREKGEKIKAIATTFRIHPMVLVSLPESGIKKPKDLIGKTIGVAYSEEMILRTLLRKRSVSTDQVNILNPRNYDIKGLINGKYDAQAAWITDEVQTARRDGVKVNIILPSDYGVVFYADLIAVNESLLEKEPQIVEDFLSATLAGWSTSIRNTKLHSKLTLLYNDQLSEIHEKQVLDSSTPLIHTGDDPIGWMSPKVWEEMYQTMILQKIVPGNANVSDMYTLDYLKKIYP